MKVILREDLQGVGNIGDILEVAPGYARNFLFPRNKAVEATGRSLKAIEHAKRVIAEKARKENPLSISSNAIISQPKPKPIITPSSPAKLPPMNSGRTWLTA